MRSAAMLFFIGLGWLACSAASAAGDLPEAAFEDKAKLMGQRRAIYLARQVDLTEAQAEQVRSLIDGISAEDQPPQLDIERVRAIWKEIEKAKNEGQDDKVDELTQELQRMNKEASDDTDFAHDLKQILTDEQKSRVDAALDRLERNPSGALRPVDLVRSAAALQLSDQQSARVRHACDEMRKILYPELRISPEKRASMIKFLHAELQKILTPEQLAAYESQIDRLRPDRITDGLRIHKP